MEQNEVQPTIWTVIEESEKCEIDKDIVISTKKVSATIPEAYYKQGDKNNINRRYGRLALAKDESIKRSPTFPLKIMAYETSQNGPRIFKVMDTTSLLNTITRQQTRLHMHEVLNWDTPSRLAFDIDVKIPLEIIDMQMNFKMEDVQKFMEAQVGQYTVLLFKKAVSLLRFSGVITIPEELQMYAISCNRPSKVSVHVIFHIDGTRFESMEDMGNMAEYLGMVTSEAHLAICEEMSNGNEGSIEYFAIKRGLLPIRHDSIYYTNKNLRTIFSSKFNNDKHCLVINTVLSKNCVIKTTPSGVLSRQHLLEQTLVQHFPETEHVIKFINCSLTEKTKTQMSLNIGLSNTGRVSKEPMMEPALIDKSAIPELTTIVNIFKEIISKYGNGAGLSAYKYFQETCVLIVRSTSRRCQTKGGLHERNNVCYIVFLGTKCYSQSCWDSDCTEYRSKNYSTVKKHCFPEPMVAPINHFIRSIRANPAIWKSVCKLKSEHVKEDVIKDKKKKRKLKSTTGGGRTGKKEKEDLIRRFLDNETNVVDPAQSFEDAIKFNIDDF